MANCIRPYMLRHPVKGWIPCSCGGCLPCRKKRAAVVKRICELTQQRYYKLHQSCSFNCITYNEANTPLGSKGLPSLCKSDYQKFFKRFRDHLKRSGFSDSFSYLGCGEYGDDHLPHYHLVLFGISDAVADKFIRKAWISRNSGCIQGIVDCKPLTAGGISYVADYVITALNGDYAKAAYDEKGIERPFLSHSVGMGVDYFLNNLDMIQENNFVDLFSGKPWLVPKYFRNYYHLDYMHPIKVKPFIERIEKEAKKNGMSVQDYQVMQQEACIKNAVLRSRAEGVPVESEEPPLRSFGKNASKALKSLAVKAKEYEDIIPF